MKTGNDLMSGPSVLNGFRANRFRAGERIIPVLIAAFVLVITSLHYVTVVNAHALHNIYREFYYVPIFLGALFYGLKGAVTVFSATVLLYLPYIVISWTGSLFPEVNRFLHILLQGLFAVVAGFLIDRDRRSRDRMEQDRYLAGVGQAAAAIVHDLKNPLITLQGFAKRIRDGKGDPERNIQTVLESASSMEAIVNDVLDFARPVRLELRNEDVGHVISRACDACRAKAEEYGVGMKFRMSEAQIEMAIDGFQLERAIVNLVSNAIEASGRGQYVEIRVTRAMGRLMIAIHDEGAGMDRETLRNIFMPFYTKKRKGTGLGMAIAKKIVDGHGGAIRIQSAPGRGTEMVIEIPHDK